MERLGLRMPRADGDLNEIIFAQIGKVETHRESKVGGESEICAGGGACFIVDFWWRVDECLVFFLQIPRRRLT